MSWGRRQLSPRQRPPPNPRTPYVADASQASAEEDFQTAAEEPLQQASTAFSTAPAPAASAVAVAEAPADDDTPRAQPVNYGSDEGLMRDDTGQTIRMAAETEY